MDYENFLVHKKKKLITEAAGLTPEVLQRTHEKFITKIYMGDEKKDTPERYLSFLKDLTEIEEKALLFFAYSGLCRLTNERAAREQKCKKKILIPKKSMVKE